MTLLLSGYILQGIKLITDNFVFVVFKLELTSKINLSKLFTYFSLAFLIAGFLLQTYMENVTVEITKDAKTPIRKKLPTSKIVVKN